MRTIVVGCDNAAVHLKNKPMGFMRKKGYTVENMGHDNTEDSTCCPYVVEKVCQEIINSGYQKHGMLVCGTGLGMTVIADKFKGVRAGIYRDIFSAERLKLNNDGNVVCMDEQVVEVELTKRILEKWLELEFVDCAFISKVKTIKEIEGENLK